MKYFWFGLFSVCLLTCLVGNVKASEVEEGFVSLFNGTNLDGWTIEEGESGAFKVMKGAIFASGDENYPTWLRSDSKYENFDLRFEFYREGWCNSGVFFHAPLHGRNSRVGFEIQIDQIKGEKIAVKTCGAIFGVVPPKVNPIGPDKTWNTGRIVMDWPMLKVWMNDQLVQDVNVEEYDELKYRLRDGYIGLQALGYNVWFRNLRIKELPSKEREQWIELFNGKNFDGWYFENENGKNAKIPATWTVQDGVIHAQNGTNYLVTKGEWEDFEFHTYFRTKKHANGGVFVRWNTLEGGDRGNEIQIENIPDSNYPTGSLYNIVRAIQPRYKDEEWSLMQIRLQGSHLVVRVNGETCVDTQKMPTVRKGHISLQMHKYNSWIDFKELKVKPL